MKKQYRVWDRETLEPLKPQREPVEGDLVHEYVGKATIVHNHFTFPIEFVEPVVEITTITKGAMQSRFSVSEEVAIIDGTDTYAKVLRERLFNSAYVDLGDIELLQGVGYLVNYLNTINAVYQNVTPIERTNKLLELGSEKEKY